MTRYYDSHQVRRMEAASVERQKQLMVVIVELAAALVRMDRNGYQERLLERALKVAGIPRTQVEEFNSERAERIAAWREKQAGA